MVFLGIILTLSPDLGTAHYTILFLISCKKAVEME